MTIITVVKKDDEIAIACDSQSIGGNWSIKYTAEYQLNRSKLLTYGENVLGLSGKVAIHQIFEDLLSQSEPVSMASRQEIFRWLLAQQKQLKEHYYLKPDAGNDKNQVTESVWISALIANPHGIFGISAYRQVIEYSKFWAIGSGENFALGAMEILYQQDLSATEIAREGALTATKFNPGCAPPIRVETIQAAKTNTKSTRRKRTTKKKK